MKIAFLTLAALTLALAGCGVKVTKTYTSEDGSTVTASNDGKTVTVDNAKGGTTTFGAVSITEKDLGVDFYPGSTETPNTSAMVETNEGKTVSCTRTTKDDPKAVADFYKGKYASLETSSVDTGDTKIAGATGKLDDGTQVTVSASKKGPEDTSIAIVTVKKK